MTRNTPDSQVNVIRPTKLCLVTRDVLFYAYEHTCGQLHLPPTEDGYGVLMGYRPDGSEVTLVTADPTIVVGLAELSRDTRDGLTLPDGAFPLAHDGWVWLPIGALMLAIDDEGTAVRGPAYTRQHTPVYPEPGSDIPGQPGYVVGECTHRVAGSEWRAGFRTCERCPTPPSAKDTPR